MGENYKFKLQKLLEIREKDEEEKKRIFKDSNKALKKEEENLKGIKSEIEKYKEENENEDIIYRRLKMNYLNKLDLKKNTCEEEVFKRQIDLENKRQEFIKSKLDRKTVEKLKENERERFYKEEQRIEQINNDEFALYGYMRKALGR